ncbi:MAG TPA: malonyl-ACP O-methyltransferase BioC [Steroidobacteraceae bacterium]|jgi:malonyl-CoA O-methyltransferase|nr:malonyl-ACP O-methyltransferase BioC [Steroidobacteraceae bacterium]
MSDDIGAYDLEPRRVRRSFDRAAKTYDAAAVLHAEVRENLLARLQLTTLTPRVVLDAGAGTGHAARALKRRYPKAQVVALDSSPQMLHEAARRRSWLRPFARVCADAGLLPLADASVDLIVSNLMLQWCNPDAVFAEFRRVLAPQGLLSFSAFGPDTLRELRTAWDQVDSHSHVHHFIDMHDLGDALVRAGFASPVLDVERYILKYLTVRKVAEDLKATGAHNASTGRARGLTGARKFAAMQAAYENFRQDGRLPATYEVVFAHAWVPAQSLPRDPKDGTSVSLEEVKRELRARRGK